jgi:hypothetical protein
MTDDQVKNIVDLKLQEKIIDLKNAAEPDKDLKKFMYDKNYEELKLCRDWAIKVSAFTSAVYFGVITLANSESGKEIISGRNKGLILVFLSLFTLLGVWNICLRHLSYLEYRNIQIKLQNDLGIHNWRDNDKEIFPAGWKNGIDFNREVFSTKNGLFKNKSGYLFYVFYLITTFAVTVVVIQNIRHKSQAEIDYLQATKSQDSLIKSSLVKILQSNERLSINIDTLNVRNVMPVKTTDNSNNNSNTSKKAKVK